MHSFERAAQNKNIEGAIMPSAAKKSSVPEKLNAVIYARYSSPGQNDQSIEG